MSTVEAPKMPRANNVYGAIVYWITIIACIICMVGPVISVASPDNNVLNPYKLFNAIFEAFRETDVRRDGDNTDQH